MTLYNRTRALDDLLNELRLLFKWRVFNGLRFWPRVGYCHCCNVWAWLTNETPAYSAHPGAYLCEDCADENDRETDYAWRDYYSSVL